MIKIIVPVHIYIVHVVVCLHVHVPNTVKHTVCILSRLIADHFAANISGNLKKEMCASVNMFKLCHCLRVKIVYTLQIIIIDGVLYTYMYFIYLCL